LKEAYDVLSDPASRAQYDVTYDKKPEIADPLSAANELKDMLDGELDRRLALLAILYVRRRTSPALPEVSLAEFETRMGFAREYLEFTMWYLKDKGLVTRSDGARFALTVDGVDFVELPRGNA
jgi:curved DNA-binding protein CbpA